MKNKYIFKVILTLVFFTSIIHSTEIYSQPLEINLSNDYLQCVSTENDLLESDILATINKWHFELYPDNPEANIPYLIANLIDSVTYECAGQIKAFLEGVNIIDDQVSIINTWMGENLKHTQTSSVFANLPGNDPWGTMNYNPFGGNFFVATFKKLLPSEMRAMSLYTGKISGKCITLANLMCSMMKCLGVSSEDFLTFQIIIDDNMIHGVGIVKFNDRLLLFNNTNVSIISETASHWLPYDNYTYTSIYNHLITREIPVDFSEQKCYNNISGNTLFGSLNIEEGDIDIDLKSISDLNSGKEIRSMVFKNKNNSDWYSLAKYSYQSLYVRKPEMYIKASLRSSRPAELLQNIKTPQQAFDWIETNISYGSVFYDSDERIMTAEQVVVFKKGTYKDQALLAATLLYKLGIDNRIYICKNSSYIEFENKIIDVSTWEETDRIDEEIILTFTKESSFTGINQQLSDEVPAFSLEQNYPNPFNTTTTICYSIPEYSSVQITIYDIFGKKIYSYTYSSQQPGKYGVQWNGKDFLGSNVASGIYLYRIEAKSLNSNRFFSNTAQMFLMN
ncbi:MAG: FlgD immunoglobulin-like domain containing protein [bacterium]